MKTTFAAVMLTRRCNMKCAHCSVESHPKIKGQPGEEELEKLLEELLAAGITTFQFTGGEPMLREDLLLRLMRRARAAGAGTAMVSNGFWGKKPAVAEQTFDRLREAGLSRLTISYDRFHAEFQGPEPVLNILEVARKRDWPIHINITRSADDTELEKIVEPFRGHPHAMLRFYDVQPVGFARSLPDQLRAELEGFCSSCEQATFTDDGRVIACNGPAYFEKSGSPLVVGERATHSVSELLTRHAADPILETIRTDGPVGLRRVLEGLPGFGDFPFKESYSGMCELCLHINRDPAAVEALREHLSSDQQAALLVAKRRVRDAARRHDHNREGVHHRLGPASALAVLLGNAGREEEKVFGRADLDWGRLAERLSETGLLHLMTAHRQNPVIARWAPAFFWRDADAAQAMAGPMLEARREDLRQATQAARDAGFEVRLAGASAVLWDGGERVPQAMELLTPGNGEALRELLKARLAPDYPIQVRHVGSLLEPTLADTARELLGDWRARLYADGMSLAWDMSWLLSRGLPVDELLREPEPGQRVSTMAACQVLREQTGLPLLAEEIRLPDSPAYRLVLKVIRYQMFRDNHGRTNLFLGAAIPLLTLQSPWYLPLALARAGRRLGYDLYRLIKARRLPGALSTARHDLREALSAGLGV